MTVSATAYGQAGGKLSSKSIDWAADNIGVLLLTSSYTPAQDTHVFVSDLTPGSNEVTGGSYARITALGGKSVTYDPTSNHTRHFGAAAVWSGVTLTARYAVIYDNTPGTDATRPLIGYIDFGVNFTATAGTFTITPDATDGYFYINAVSGGLMADGPLWRDLRVVPNIADLGSITLGTTQKCLWTPGSTSPTILPANYWTEGKTVKLTANLKWTAVANTNGVTVGMCYGSADAAAVEVVATAVTPVSGTSTFDVIAEGYATCRLRGGSATLSMFGRFLMPTGLTTTGIATFPSAGATVVSTFDSTVATNGLYFQAARATAAGDTVVCTSLLMEAMN